MKKIFFSVCILLLLIAVPIFANADGLVPCGNAGEPACGINDFFKMLVNIYNFIVLMIATPLAVIAIIIGAIFMMISAGNPNMMATGKKILYAAIIGLVLVFGSWLIIDFILKAIGFTGNWSAL